MVNLAKKDILSSYRWAPAPLRSMLLKKDRSHQLLIEGVRKYRPDASAGEGLRLNLSPGTPVLAPADMQLVEASEGGSSGPCAVFRSRRHIFTFYNLAFNDGLSDRPVRAGSVIGTAGDGILHLMVTTRRLLDGGSGKAVDAMDLIEKGIIRPPFMPVGPG